MKKKLIMILTAGCIALTACSSLNRSEDNTSLAALTVETTQEQALTNEASAEAGQSTNVPESAEETSESIPVTAPWEGEEGESASEESAASEPATAAETTAAATAATEIDIESAFKLAGITVEKIDKGYLLTYPAGALGDLTVEEMREAYGSEDIIISNDDGSVSFRLTDDEFAYMAESFRQSRNSAVQ